MKVEQAPNLSEEASAPEAGVENSDIPSPEGVTQPEAEVKEFESQEGGSDAILQPEAELGRIGKAMEDNEKAIAELQTRLTTDRAGLAKVREALGLGSKEDQHVGEERLNKLLDQQKELGEEKEEMETVDALNEVLDQLSKLPKPELLVVIQNGKNSKGEQLVGPDGKKVQPDVAKKLATLVEKGVTKLTKAILDSLLGIVKGVIKAIFETAKGAQSAE